MTPIVYLGMTCRQELNLKIKSKTSSIHFIIFICQYKDETKQPLGRQHQGLLYHQDAERDLVLKKARILAATLLISHTWDELENCKAAICAVKKSSENALSEPSKQKPWFLDDDERDGGHSFTNCRSRESETFGKETQVLCRNSQIDWSKRHQDGLGLDIMLPIYINRWIEGCWEI